MVSIILLNMGCTEIKETPFIRALVSDGSSNLLDEISWETPHLLLFYCILCIWNEDNDELRHYYEWDQDLERAENLSQNAAKSIVEVMVFFVLKKLIGRWNKVFKTLKVLQETCGGLGQLKVFTLWTPRIFWNSSKDKNYAFSVFCSFLVSFMSFYVLDYVEGLWPYYWLKLY